MLLLILRCQFEVSEGKMLNLDKQSVNANFLFKCPVPGTDTLWFGAIQTP